jgi:hypothetical protein
MQIISRYTDDADQRELFCQFTDVIFPGADIQVPGNGANLMVGT